MANLVTFIYGTEAQILALTPASDKWIENAFYYPRNCDYFYQIVDGVLKRYGTGNTAGVGIKLNGLTIGGVKQVIEETDVLDVPENWEYNVFDFSVEGVINLDGVINIIENEQPN